MSTTYVVLVTLPEHHGDGDPVEDLDANNVAARNWEHHDDHGNEVPATEVVATAVDGATLAEIRALLP